MSRFSLLTRLVALAAVLLGVLLASNLYFSNRLSQDARVLAEQARSISQLKRADAAGRAFGDLKYWLTDLAVSLLVRSEQKAYEARDVLFAELDRLEEIDPETAQIVRAEVEALIEQAVEAVDAYTEDRRVIGNALMAQARQHIGVVDARLTDLIDRLERQAVARRDAALLEAERAADVSVAVLLAAILIGLVLTFLVLRSITVPLRGLVGAMSAITAGKLDTPIPQPGHDEIGTMTRTLALFRDSLVERDRLAAERAKAEAALREAQTQLLEAIESISEGFALYGPDDRLVICNSKYQELYTGLGVSVEPGVSYEAVIRAAIDGGVIAEAREDPEAWIARRLERHRNPKGPYEQRRADGRWLKISERRTQDGSVVGVFTDITELKVRQVQLSGMVDTLAAARDQASAATRAKSQFLANMSHELRTPLNAVIGITEMLQEDAQDQGLDDFLEPLERIGKAGKHLLHLINEVLDLSKIEAGKLRLQAEDFDLSRLLEEAIATTRPLAAKNGNRLTLRCADGLGRMRSDQMRLRQIVLNLLSNASKFTSEGEITLEAERGAKGAEDWITLRVTDTGIGMTVEQMKNLFQEFSQADGSTTRKYGGTGLGLAICRRLCRLMGGEIDAESSAGVGSAFTVRLPARMTPPPDQAEMTGEEPVVTPVEPAAQAPRNNMVLVVDDDPTVLDLMRSYLARQGYDVITAASGEEGLRIARELKPSVITLDVLMPHMDGWSVLREAKSDPELSAIPVIMLTILDDAQKGFALGAAEFMTKPIDRARLREILAKYTATAGSRHVLVVEDDEATRALLNRMLVSEGWAVSTAANGLEALDRVQAARPDLILLDLMMPEMDGFDFLVELHKRPGAGEIPVVVVTAADLTETDYRRLNGAAEHVLRKAAHPQEDLLEELRGLVARYLGDDTEKEDRHADA